MGEVLIVVGVLLLAANVFYFVAAWRWFLRRRRGSAERAQAPRKRPVLVVARAGRKAR
jgi:hypothetical protein